MPKKFGTGIQDSTEKWWRDPNDVSEIRELTFDKLTDYEEDQREFKVSLFGYTGAVDSWKEAKPLPYNKIVQYFQTKRQSVPREYLHKRAYETRGVRS